MERLTAFNGGIWGMSMQAIANGYDRYSVFSRLAEYEETGLTPQNIICREDDIKLLQRQNKEFREEILKLREENTKLYNQLMETEKAYQELNQFENTQSAKLLEENCKLKKDRDFWEREAKKYCSQLGEIRILAETVN